MPFLSVIVPCCNEEGNIPVLKERLLPALAALGVTWELVCVDDGSTDGTRAALEALAAGGSDVRVEVHAANLGLASALKTGFAASKGDWLVPLDADLTFPAESIAELLRVQKETDADCVAGSPILGSFEGVPFSRQLPSRILNAVYALLFEPNLTAYTPLLRLYRAQSVMVLPITSKGFEVNAELLVRLLKAGAKVVEVPVTLRTRTWGASKLRRFRELSRHARLIMRLMLS